MRREFNTRDEKFSSARDVQSPRRLDATGLLSEFYAPDGAARLDARQRLFTGATREFGPLLRILKAFPARRFLV
jgi:hypothetical protein